MLLFAYNLSAQTEEECGTEPLTEAEAQAQPWYGNDTYLQAYFDSLQAIYGNPSIYQKTRNTSNDIEGLPNVWLRIPIQFWIYQTSPTVPGGTRRLPHDRDIKNMMDDLNNAFRRKNIPVRFYIACVEFINDPTAIDVNSNKARELCNARNNISGVDVHIVDVFRTNSGNRLAGRYYSVPNAIVITRRVPVELITTFTHEVGHYFGLEHTFGWSGGWLCLDEPVSRGYQTRTCPPFYARWCNRTGDYLCDTPADPNMANNGTFNGCIWTWNGTDRQGDTYNPDTRNYMAYGNNFCRNNFSPQQG